MKRKEALCTFGIGLEEAKEMFSSWIQEEPSRKIFLLEEGALQNLAWQHLLFDLKLALSPVLSEEQKQLGSELFERLKFWQIGAEALLADVKDQGKKVADNILSNLPLLEGAYFASSLAQSYKGIPALICGAGPSLHRHLPLLKIARERTLLFAGGTALKVVAESGSVPHFAAALDPDPPPPLFSSEAIKGVPFFFPLRLAKRILLKIEGPRIWAADGISYPLEHWLTKQLGLDEPNIEGGWNVATFCISLAAMMGCNPIVLVGVDLSLPEGKSYTSDVDHSYQKNHLIETTQGLTKGDFILAADWIASFKENHPSIQLINVSKEAWPMEGVDYCSLDSLIKRFPQHGISSIEESSLGLQVQCAHAPSEIIQGWKRSLAIADDHCASLIERLEKNFPSDPRQLGNYILHEVELEEEPAAQFFLEPIWMVWKHLFNEEDLNEPYRGFRETVQKWLFWRSIIKEMDDAAV